MYKSSHSVSPSLRRAAPSLTVAAHYLNERREEEEEGTTEKVRKRARADGAVRGDFWVGGVGVGAKWIVGEIQPQITGGLLVVSLAMETVGLFISDGEESLTAAIGTNYEREVRRLKMGSPGKVFSSGGAGRPPSYQLQDKSWSHTHARTQRKDSI